MPHKVGYSHIAGNWKVQFVNAIWMCMRIDKCEAGRRWLTIISVVSCNSVSGIHTHTHTGRDTGRLSCWAHWERMRHIDFHFWPFAVSGRKRSRRISKGNPNLPKNKNCGMWNAIPKLEQRGQDALPANLCHRLRWAPSLPASITNIE